ncbi:ABC transporter, permease protein [Hyella patelloides LEGE 07179]|uniref:ABC transporter, permease protein n=1 Tax=Hyella patelloides LEGE 07179 TaxID=945734 RepID=A0A563VPB1_9CYAN|nr:ABC transporter permease [Hyella patelloides]VEP13308.1 ABC transporter, permease protein [Hyella patelloides LEGE 07179]
MLAEMISYIIENSQDFTTALGEHLELTLIALGISIAFGLLLGIIGSRFRSLRNFLLNVGKIGRTIPSLAVLALSLPLLGIGKPPTLLALTLIGTLPILINTIIGLEQVDKDTKEAAVGMGMKDLQILRQLELPIALPVIMAGIRTAAVVIVAGATLAGFIGGGGLGDLILNGHQLGRDHVMLAGAIPATLLSFYFEEAFGRLETWATPKGLTDETRQSGGLIGLLLAIAVMPLIFGTLLPWSITNTTGEAPTVLTGIHPEYRGIGLPILVLGLVATLWPRRGEKGNSWPITLVTWGAAIAALLWFVVGLFSKIDALETSGLVLLLASVVSITAITSLELVLSYRNHRANPRRIKELQTTL